MCIFMNMCMDMFKIMEVFLLLTACNNILADKILRADFFFLISLFGKSGNGSAVIWHLISSAGVCLKKDYFDFCFVLGEAGLQEIF